MGDVTITITGIDQTLMALGKEAAKCNPASLRPILMEAAVVVETAWKSKVPVDTGRYRDDIHIESGETGLAPAEVDITTSAENPDDEYPYPLALEYGTAFMAAQPSATPAIEETRDQVQAIIKAGLEGLFAHGISAAYAAGDIAAGQGLNRALGALRGGSSESGGAMR